MVVNWSIEAWKWKIGVSNILPLSFRRAFKALLSGVSFSITTPNRIGENIGRIMYLPEGHRLEMISITVVTSLSQLIITMLSGTIAFFLLKNYLITAHIISNIGYRFILVGLSFLIIGLLLLYTRISGIVKLFKWAFKNSRHLY